MTPSLGEGTILFGGSGFLGPYILRNYPDVVSVGRTPPPTDNVHVQVDDLSNLNAIDDLQFDNVVYIIGNTDHRNLEKEHLPRDELNAFDYHVIPFLRTMEQIKHRPIRKLMCFSTILIYDSERITLPVSEHAPIDPYKNRYVLSKFLAEEAAKFYSAWMPIITVRLSNLYGPTPLRRFDLIHVLSRQLLEKGRGEVWSTKPERDFIYVEDVAHAVMRLMESDYTGTLNLGTGTMTSIARIVELLEELSGCPIEIQDVPVLGPMQFQCDMTTIRKWTDWEPLVPIEEGVRLTYEMMKTLHEP